jgi:glycosyl hydrolase family 113
MVAHPWHQGMPQLGIDVYWTGNAHDSDMVIRAKAERIIAYAISLGANSISLTFPFYTHGITSDTLYAGKVTTPSPARVAIFLAVAAESHIRATLRPVLNENSLVAQNPKAWRGSIEPESTSAWFASYRKLLLPYAQVAQSEHAATFVIGTEMNSLEGDPNWPTLVSAISSVYHGQLAYDENFDSFQQHDTNLPLDTFGVDAYPRFQLPDSASVSQLAQAWEDWLGSHSTAVLHDTVLSEVGISAVAGAYDDPGAWLGTANSPVVPEVQANWYSAVCRAFSVGKLAGIYWWEVSFDADPSHPSAFLSDRLTFLARPAQQEVSSCFNSISASENGSR